jgi:hypothetical protein
MGLYTSTEKRTYNTNTKHPCPEWDLNPHLTHKSVTILVILFANSINGHGELNPLTVGMQMEKKVKLPSSVEGKNKTTTGISLMKDRLMYLNETVKVQVARALYLKY